jgi:hypothetical protein
MQSSRAGLATLNGALGLDGEPWQVKVETAGGCPPPGRSRLSEILDQDLPGLDDRQLSADPELVPNVRSEHQCQAHHIQSVVGIVALLATKLHRDSGKVGKAPGYPA